MAIPAAPRDSRIFEHPVRNKSALLTKFQSFLENIDSAIEVDNMNKALSRNLPL